MLKHTVVFALSSLALVAVPAQGADYLSDLLRNPTYLASWNKLIGSEPDSEPWLRRYGETHDGVTIPSKRIPLSTGTHTAAWVCQPHNCGPRQFFVLFAPDGKAAWGIFLKDSQEETVFGAPDEEILSAIRQYIQGPK